MPMRRASESVTTVNKLIKVKIQKLAVEIHCANVTHYTLHVNRILKALLLVVNMSSGSSSTAPCPNKVVMKVSSFSIFDE